MSYGVEALLTQRTEIDAELRKHKSPVTVMFTDLAGSTSYFDRYGDTAGVKWIEEHNRIVIPQVKKFGGTVVKTIGDSVMAYFTDPLEAVRAGVAIERSLLEANAGKDKKDCMFVRVALHQGLGYLRGGDVFGDVVNVTARMAKACLPAQVLVSESVYLAVQGAEQVELRPAGEALFHGKSEKESLFEVLWTDERTYAELRALFPPKKAAAQQEELREGRYRIMGELGRGAMGVVYKAYDRIIGRVVALKTIPVEVEASEKESLIERLKVEARAAGMLDHPNIITVYDVGEEAGLFYFTMQFIEGKTLAQAHADRDLLPLPRVLELMKQLCDGVGFAHQAGVIHRDLKPSNLVITKQGALKILDFGIAKLADVGLTKAGMIMGTPSYLAPEQASGRRIDNRADIFSMGAILYELLTGERAFPGESTTTVLYKILNEEPIPPRAIEPSLPPALDSVVRKALAKDPLQRFQSCAELGLALEAIRAGAPLDLPLPAGSPGAQTTMLSVPPPPPRKLWLPVAALAVLAAIGAAGGWLWMKRAPQASRPAPTAVVQPPAAAVPATSQAMPNPAPTTPAAAPSPAEAAAAQPAAREVAKKKESAAKSTVPAELKGKAKPAKLEEEDADIGKAGKGDSLFTSGDVPALLARADRLAGTGDYPKAISLYQAVLRVDPKNQGARDGIRRAREAQGVRP